MGESKRDKIRDQTIGVGLGIIPHPKGMTELAQLRLYGQVIRTGGAPKWPNQLYHRKRDQKNTPTDLQEILKERGNEWKAVRTTARACGRWKAVFKPSTPTGRRIRLSEQ
jgi:hypothetical protein